MEIERRERERFCSVFFKEARRINGIVSGPFVEVVLGHQIEAQS